MTTTIAVASARDTCETLFADNPAAVVTVGTEQWMTVMLPGTGDSAYFMIVRDAAAPGRYAVCAYPGDRLGEVEDGTEPPGEITDILADGIPVTRGARS